MSARRQRVVLAEFAASVVVGVGVSMFVLAHAGGWGLVVGMAALGFAASEPIVPHTWTTAQ
jgi:F0F1-type ATP synthase assembly protein I